MFFMGDFANMLAWYFAYGRNINVSRLCERISTTGTPKYPLLIRKGILPGYRLVFNKDPGGFANIEPAPEEYVEGILYLLTQENIAQLDRHEGVPTHYVRKIVHVWNIEDKQ